MNSLDWKVSGIVEKRKTVTFEALLAFMKKDRKFIGLSSGQLKNSIDRLVSSNQVKRVGGRIIWTGEYKSSNAGNGRASSKGRRLKYPHRY